jgi:hypothetical protein
LVSWPAFEPCDVVEKASASVKLKLNLPGSELEDERELPSS